LALLTVPTGQLSPDDAEGIAVGFPVALAKKNVDHDMRIEPTMIDGSVGALLYLDGEVDHTFSMAIDGERIAVIYIVRNPDKLRHVPASTRH
jgi:RNA polymerase sigma-70 factor, ECF subfamily